MSTVPSGTRFIGISGNVSLKERKSAVLNAETQPYTIEDLAATVGVGSEGPQGVEGPAGPPGPVGPAGLEWQGEWVSGTSYVADDAVGYDGASWFCILATSGTTAPDVDSTHWALLASQGAVGPAGAQGPTGPQGPAGSASAQTSGTLEIENVSPYQILSYDLNTIITTGASDKVVLPSSAPVGKIVYVFARSNFSSFTVRGNQAGSALISTGGVSTQTSSITVRPNESYLFTSLGGGFWKSEAIGPNLQQVVDNGNTVASGNFKTTLQSTGIISENIVSLSKIEVIPTQIKLIRNNAGLRQTNLYCSLTPTDNRNIYLPDASGTVALQTYKSYVARITHGAGNGIPTAVVIINEIGTVTWQYDDIGEYSLVSSGLFTLNKTIVFATSPSFPLMKVGVSVNSPNFVGLTTENDAFTNLMLEIRVYN
jgi:hypothetical protein